LRGAPDTSLPADSATVLSPAHKNVQPVQFRRQEVNKIDIAGQELVTNQVFNAVDD
jgi:hypothetical protein